MRILLISLFVMVSSTLFAQIDSTSVAQYFADSGDVSRKNQLKVDLLTIVFGELPFSYERELGKSISVELGAGVLLPHYLPEIFSLGSEASKTTGGNSFRFQGKFFSEINSKMRYYLEVRYRNRNFQLPIERAMVQDLSLLGGYEILRGKGLIIDFYGGVGFLLGLDELLSETSLDPEDSIFVPFGMKIGYLF